MNNDTAYYIGYSARDCNSTEYLYTKEAEAILDNTKVTFIGFDVNNGEYNSNQEYIKPCLGFMVYKEDKPEAFENIKKEKQEKDNKTKINSIIENTDHASLTERN
jgi:hypothetical protein